MNITKDQFVKIIGSVMNQQRRDYEIAKALDKVVEDGDNQSLVFHTPLVESIIEALDFDGIISWWFWDGCSCGVNADDFAIYLGDHADPKTERVIIYTPEDLYDYIERAKEF